MALDGLGCPAASAPLPADRAGIPVWPDGYVGSISHSDSAAIALVSRKQDHACVGVDLEPVASTAHAPQIAALVGTVAEFSELTELARPLAVLVTFCAKEALYKALLPGRILEFGAARLRRADEGVIEMELMERWSETRDRGTAVDVRWTIAFGHVITAVVGESVSSKPVRIG